MKFRKILYLVLVISLLIVGGGFVNNFVKKEVGLARNENIRGEDGSGKIEDVNSSSKKYSNTEYGFSFEYPSSFTVGQFYDGEGESIVVQEASSTSSKSGFQVYVSSVEAPVEITPELIKKELPGTLVSNPQKIELDGKDKGMLFSSNSPAFDGKSAEIWFYYQGRVYQVTSYPEGAQKMMEIIGTWKFR
jgi:hypothetical protein